MALAIIDKIVYILWKNLRNSEKTDNKGLVSKISQFLFNKSQIWRG